MSNKIWVVIPAAGVGARMQADRPKQYLPLAGQTIIEHTLNCFLQHPQIAGIVVAISAGDPYWPELAVSQQVHTAAGGKERADSVLNALQYLQTEIHADAEDYVLVHDAARPCLHQDDLKRLLQAGQQSEAGALLAMPVRDTMKRSQADSAYISHTEDRNNLWHALTPQMARLQVLAEALAYALQKGLAVTDEASALEFAGLHPLLVEGDASNIKVTRPADLALAEFLLAQAVSNK